MIVSTRKNLFSNQGVLFYGTLIGKSIDEYVIWNNDLIKRRDNFAQVRNIKRPKPLWITGIGISRMSDRKKLIPTKTAIYASSTIPLFRLSNSYTSPFSTELANFICCLIYFSKIRKAIAPKMVVVCMLNSLCKLNQILKCGLLFIFTQVAKKCHNLLRGSFSFILLNWRYGHFIPTCLTFPLASHYNLTILTKYYYTVILRISKLSVEKLYKFFNIGLGKTDISIGFDKFILQRAHITFVIDNRK